jgi:SSS family solute:Na+ symporter
MMVQRVLGAKNLDHGRWGSIFAGFLKLPILFIMIMPGVFAVVLYPDLPTPDLAFPTLAFDLLPIGVRGIILAALIAAITSTVDSILNSASTVVTMDFVRPLRPRTSDRRLVLAGRLTTVAVTLIAVIWSPQIQNFPSLWQYLQSILSYVTPPVVAVFLLGIFWKRANANAAFVTFVAGVGLGLVFFILNEVMGVFAIHFLYAAGVSFVLSAALIVVISLVTPPSGKEVAELTWNTGIWRKESEALAGVPWYQNYRYLAIFLLLTTAVIVVAFW